MKSTGPAAFIGLIVIGLLGFVSEAFAYWASPGMDWESYPRVLYGPGEEEAIRTRLEREPYLTLYRRVYDIANRAYTLDDHAIGAEQSKGNIAKAAAFVYAMNRKPAESEGTWSVVEMAGEERAEYGARTEELLHAMWTHSRMENFFSAGLDIHTAEELTLWATAYDTLKGAGYPFADEAGAIANVVALASDFFGDYTYRHKSQMAAYNENHMSKSASALGLAAIALNGYPGYLPEEDPEGFAKPENWIDFAVNKTDFIVLDALVSREGSFSEAAVYYGYTAVNHLPFMRALHRYAGPEGWTVNGFAYGDLLMREENRRIHDWLVRIRLPDGAFPPFDDCTPKGQYAFGAVGDLPNGGLYRWAWEHQPTYAFAGGSVDLSIETIVAYDDAVEAVPPDALGWPPNQFLIDGGQAVFRSSWGPEAVYMLVAAEHGKAAGWALRRDGEPIDGAGGHDHNDPCALHLYAYGQPLLLDAGYLGWDNHNKVNNPKNHNLLLVDGKGPSKPELIVPTLVTDENGDIVVKEGEEGGWVPGPDGEAFLNDFFDMDGLAYARIDTHYGDEAPATAISRHALFVRGRYFIVFDEAHGEDGAAHDFTIQWQGNGGGLEGFAQRPAQYGNAHRHRHFNRLPV